MEIKAVLDKEGYIESFAFANLSETVDLEGQIVVDIQENFNAFKYVYQSYKIIDGKVIYDKDRLTEEVQRDLNPPPTKEEKLEQRVLELENLVNQLLEKM